MAGFFTVTQYAETLEYAYNPFYFKIASSNSSKLNHKFIIDIYGGPSVTDYVGRFKSPVIPSSGFTIYSPARVLENYVSSYINPAILSPENTNNSQYTYQLYFGEEYDTSLSFSASTGVTIHSGLTATTYLYILNAAKQYPGTIKLSAYTHSASNPAPPLLTAWPVSGEKKIRRGEWETMGATFMNSNEVIINTYDSASTQIGNYIITASAPASTSRFTFPTGYANLTQTATNTLTSSAETIMSSSVYSYTVAVGYGGSERSAEYVFVIDDECVRYPTKRLAWLNSLGAHDYFTFKLISDKSIQRKPTEWQRRLPFDYTVGDRGRTNLNIQLNEQFTISTDWVDDDEADFLQSCFKSTEHWLIDSTTGDPYPLILIDKNIQYKNINNDRLFNFTMTFEYAYDVNAQRT